MPNGTRWYTFQKQRVIQSDSQGVDQDDARAHVGTKPLDQPSAVLRLPSRLTGKAQGVHRTSHRFLLSGMSPIRLKEGLKLSILFRTLPGQVVSAVSVNMSKWQESKAAPHGQGLRLRKRCSNHQPQSTWIRCPGAWKEYKVLPRRGIYPYGK